MSYRILGRKIPNEYLALGVLFTTGALASRVGGGSSGKDKAVPSSVQQAKASVPITADSPKEEEFIMKFIEEAEKENARH